MRKVTDNVYVLWALLALPAVWFLAHWFVLNGKVPFVPWTGILSCWLLIVTMAVTPLQLLLGPMPWLRKRRRYLGVASFGYAMLHLAFWVANEPLRAVIRSVKHPDILAGWIAMAIMTVLAITSFDGAVDRLGPAWKRIQRWIYPMAVLTLAHWLMTDSKGWATIAAYTLPLIALEAWRIVRYRRRMRRA